MYRVGIGFDIHRLEKGKGFFLGGVWIPAPFQVKAHSDGDVLLHAMVDALLGGIGEGDIGEFFPETQENKGRRSIEFLLFAKKKVEEKGYLIHQIDNVLLLEKPKITPYKRKIRENIATSLHLPLNRISIKATTTEQLGDIGKGKGIACYSVALLKRKLFPFAFLYPFFKESLRK